VKRQTTRRHGEMTNGHHQTKPDGSRQQTYHAEADGHHPTAIETAKQYLVEAAKQHTEATRCHPCHRPAGGLSEMWWERALGKRLVSGASIAANDREMASSLSRREASGDRTILIEEEQQLSATVMIGGNSYKATIDTGERASFVSEKMADNIATLGRITRTRRQVRLADERCGRINAQPVDFTRSSGSVGVGMELPETSRNRDKVC